MQNRWLRLFSLFLALVLLVQTVPAQAVAAQVPAEETSVQNDAVLTDAQIVEEVISGRTEFSKEFKLDNGLHVAALYADAVHYDAGGTWEEIDNTLRAKLNGTFSNTAGDWDVAFPQILSGNREIAITKDGYTLSFGMAGELRQQGNLEIMSQEEPALAATVPEETAAAESTLPQETTAPEAEETLPEETTEPEETQPQETTPAEGTAQSSSASQAAEEPEAAAITEETVPETTAPEETVPETTTPAETAPEETQPETTAPQVTEPEETEPETTAAALELDGDLSISADTATVTVNGVSQTFAVTAAQSAMGIVQSIDKTEALAAAEHEEFVLTKSASQLLYSNVYGTTDIQYDLRGNQLKESIILEAYSSTLRGYRYTLNTGTLVPVLNDDGSIYFYDEEEENIILCMPAPYLVDANDEYNHDIHVSLTGSNGTYTLIYLLPQAWLAETSRAWPVVLDPIVSTKPEVRNIKDRTIASNGTFTVGDYYLEVGYGPSDHIERAYLKYDNLPAITSADVIVEANLQMYKPEASYNGNTIVEVHKVPNTWESETITWTGNENNYNPNIEDYAVVFDMGLYNFDVTDIVREWYAGVNTGLMFKAPDAVEQAGGNSWKRFFSSDVGTLNQVPTLTIVFKNTTGIEDHWDYTTASAGRAGTGYVNTFSGNLTWIRSDIGFGGNRMPVSISHTYNTSEANTNNFGMGYGWRTNFNQRVYQWSEDSDYYIWEDGDGTQHYFMRSSAGSSIFYDQEGLEMTLRINISQRDYPGTEKYYVSDKYGNFSYFDANGRLISQVNNQETESYIAISYNDSGFISTVTDGVGRKYNFTYESNLLNRISYTGTGTEELSYVAFWYGDDENWNDGTGNLQKVIDNDGKSSNYTYLGSHILTTAADIDGYTLTYAYNTPDATYQTWRVSNVSAKQGTTDAGSLNIAYAHNQTTLTDHNGNKEIRQFNDYGNVVSIQDNEGRAQYAKYAVNSAGDTGKANQLSLSSKLQYTVSNRITDSSLENGTVWTPIDAAATGTSSSDQAYTGSKSMKLVTTASSALVSGNITVPEGETYTFSAYVKATQGSAGLAIRNPQYIREAVYSPEVTASDGWTRLEVSYTNTTGMNTNIYLAFSGDGSTTAYMDCVQLEKSPTASRYNLVENGDFRNGSTGWTVSDTAAITLQASTNDIAAPQLDAQVYQFTGDPLKKLNVSQTVPVSGEAGDTFVIAGWAKGDAAALSESEDYPREYGIVATFNYVSDGTSTAASDEDEPKKFVARFNPNMGSDGLWQYSSEVMVAEKDYTSITVEVTYDHNVHTVKFDGIQLYKEEFGNSYTYDDEGNVISVVDLQKQETKYEYTDNKLTAEILPSGARMEYKYENNNVIEATSAENIVYKFTYDAYGNNTSVSIYDKASGVSITSKATYTSDGNHTESTTDAQGKTTLYGYNQNTSVLEWIQYPEDDANSRTEYTYDNMYRMSTTEVNVKDGTCTNPLIRASYSYTDDLLTNIATNSTTYHYTYGDLALPDSVYIDRNSRDALANIVLVEYTYNSDNYLSRLDYGNHDSVNYTYDSHGRVLTETYEDGDVISYKYDNSGALATVTDSATGRTTTYYYDFTERLLKYVEKGTGYYHSVGYEYDKINNLTALVENIDGVEHKTSYTYDKDNRITTVVADTAGIQYGYDEYGRIEQQTTKSVNLDQWNTLLQEQNTSEETTDEPLTLPGDTAKTDFYTYNTSNQSGTTVATSQINRHTVSTDNYSASYVYSYDDNGNIISVQESKTYSGTTTNKTASYEYDSANQLIREENPALDLIQEWTYDNAGNIASVSKYNYTTGELEDTFVYNYNNANWGDQLTGVTKGNVSTTYSYDEIGNLTFDGTRTYTWEHGRQLAELKKGNITYTYTYDANGMRTSRSNGTTTAYYVYNGDQLMQMKLVSYEGTANEVVERMDLSYDSDGTPLALTYTRDGSTLNDTYYYLTNVQGDVIGLTDSAGNIVIEYLYDAYGAPSVKSYQTEKAELLARVNPLLYRGYVYDLGANLYYLQTRYYDAALGRFINADDALILNGGSDQTLGNNLFTYCFNNPVNRSDNSGTWPSWATKVLIGTAVIAVAAVLTVATAGTGTALACFAVGALKGAVAGAAMGAVTGAATGAVTHRVTTGSWDGAGQAALEGAADGYMSGAISGFVSGGMTSNACFVAGTTVLTAAGTAAIETIQKGDMVWAWDEETGDVALKEVVETYINETDELIHVHVNGEEIITTPSHPFYSPVKGWTSAVHLRAGDILVLVNGEYVVVEKVQHEILEAPILVYNFQVEDYHTYYVTAIGVVVHNLCVKQNNPGASGQQHHPISRQIENAASNNNNLKGIVTRKGCGTMQANTLQDHIGYQKWHRNFDKATVTWLNKHQTATLDEFLDFMNRLYSSNVATSRFGTVSFV